MTRVTNFGIKRTYVQAGFSSDGAAEPDTREGGDEGEATRNSEQEGLPKKRRRNRKRKLNKVDGAPTTTTTSNTEEGKHGKTQAPNPKNGSFKSRSSAKVGNARRQVSSESRRMKRIRERMADTTCFVCREKGHTAKECHTAAKTGMEEAGASVVGICYRYVVLHQAALYVLVRMANATATAAGVARQDTTCRGAKSLLTSFARYPLHRVLYVTKKATSRRHVRRTKTRGYTRTGGVVSCVVIRLIWRKIADCGSKVC